MDLVGYVDRWNVQPGAEMSLMVSCRTAEFTAKLVRLRHADANPAGPGLKIYDVPDGWLGVYPGVERPIKRGSCMVVADQGRLAAVTSFTWGGWIWPTLPGGSAQALFAKGQQIVSYLDHMGHLCVDLDGRMLLRSAMAMPERQWLFIAFSYDAAAGQAMLMVRQKHAWPGADVSQTLLSEAPAGLMFPAGDMVLGAKRDRDGGFTWHYNGKIATPWLFSRPLTSAELDLLNKGFAAHRLADCLAAWNMSGWDMQAGMHGDRVPDRSGHGLHGHTYNMPTRAVTGPAWNGEHDDFRAAPAHYDALHFHDDDLTDAQWPPSCRFHVPDHLPSGIYAVHLQSGAAQDYIPFFVRPPHGGPYAKVAFLAPTFSYLAYSNWQAWSHPSQTEPMMQACGDDFYHIVQRPDNQYITKNAILSLYDSHRDGSGVCYAGRRRPHINMRPGYIWPLFRGGCPHQFVADLHLIDWLEQKSIGYDVITDDDLHEEGVDLLRPYQVVLTGSHPEYHTSATLDGLTSYLHNGGRLMYMGGNGFYWVTARTDSGQAIEIRRSEGTRTWMTAPGETRMSLTGELGGLWRSRGRAPQTLVGVGFTSVGVDEGVPYRRTDASHDPRVQFIFQGIGYDEPIGDFPCLAMGRGASGMEIDRHDLRHGSPPHALVVASAWGFSDSYQLVVEDLYATVPGLGGSSNPQVRADMTYLQYPNGGAVWSVGSIGWCSGLSYNNYDNAVSRITENVLREFLRQATP